MKPFLYRQRAPLIDPDSVIEEEALNIIRGLNAAERAKFAQKLARWAEQCFESAVLMNPELGKAKPAPKVPRAFFLVNLAQWEKDDMQRMARECGLELRGVLRWAFGHVHQELKDMHRITKLTGLSPTEHWPLRDGNPNN